MEGRGGWTERGGGGGKGNGGREDGEEDGDGALADMPIPTSGGPGTEEFWTSATAEDETVEKGREVPEDVVRDAVAVGAAHSDDPLGVVIGQVGPGRAATAS